jgi:hypothetical protein
MSSGKCAFKETDVKRAIRAVLATGLDVLGVVIGKDGAIDVRVSKEKQSVRRDEIIKKLRHDDDRAG